MATGIVVGMAASMAVGTVARAATGQRVTLGTVGMDALGGALGGAGGIAMSTGGTMIGGAMTQTMSGAMGGVMSGAMGGVAGGGAAAAGGAGASAGGAVAGSVGGGGSYLGLMSSFGKSVLSNSQKVGDAQYNSQMAELHNYRTVQQGVYGQNVSYKEAEIVKRESEIRLAALRRELYRRNHSVGGYRGVRLDSGSIVDVQEDLIKQANYDMEIVKYQADIDAGRHIDQGNMSLWNAESSATLSRNEINKQEQDVSSAAANSIMKSGMDMAGSLLSS
ncbi:hypothetical protein [Maridesulfovibrio sp. FT414]|uniref:hypothetical protein n=1 Tax=Maridesulfovibrio sp. FT414 TaxID=2979469 RepID=UPI003D8008B5